MACLGSLGAWSADDIDSLRGASMAEINEDAARASNPTHALAV